MEDFWVDLCAACYDAGDGVEEEIMDDLEDVDESAARHRRGLPRGLRV